MRRVAPIVGGVTLVVIGGVVLWTAPWADGDEQTGPTSVVTVTTVDLTEGEGTEPTTIEAAAVTSTTTPSSTASTTIPRVTTTQATTTTSELEPPASTSTTRPPTTTSPDPVIFRSSISSVDADDLDASWRSGCPLEVESLRALDVTHWGFDGKTHTGRLIVAAQVAEDMADIMRDLFTAGFPIQRMEPVDVYAGDDDASMAANNTSAFNCRAVTGGSSWSEHSYGAAIDINPLINPYVRGSTVLPPEGSRYADRTRDDPGMIHAGDSTVDAFSERGWIWGGTWSSPKDYQHFSTSGR